MLCSLNPKQKVNTMFSLDGKFLFTRITSEDMKRDIYRLRYQIYIEEFGFEKAEDHPNGLEIDPYDAHAVHLAALDNAHQIVGTARLVLHSDKGFPIEHATTLQQTVSPSVLDRTAEVSRLALSAQYRRRTEDGQHGVESYLPVSEGGSLSDSGELGGSLSDSGELQPNSQRRRRPLIVLGLYKLIWQTSKRLGLTHWYMISEKKLWTALFRFGLLFRQIGEPVDYHGLRIPYMISLAEFENHLCQHNPSLYQMFLEDLEEEYRPQVSS